MADTTNQGRPVGRPRTRGDEQKRLRLSVYVDPATEKALRLAAVLENQTLTDFVTTAATERAREILGRNPMPQIRAES